VSAPWLSVIVPTYNGAKYLRGALDSIVLQAGALIEIVAIDDGSTDDTLAVLHEYQSRLNLNIIQRRVGNWADNTNHALQLARGAYACFLHQDDLWLPGRLSAIQEQLSLTPNIALLLHACEFIDEQGRSLGPWRCPYPGHKALSPAFAVERLLVQNFVGMPGATIRRETALKVGGLDPSLWYTADWDLWLKLALVGPTVYMPGRYGAFRLHPQSQTADRSRSLDDFRRQMEMMTERHAAAWPARSAAICDVVMKAARASIEVNVALAAAYHGQKVSWRKLLTSLRSANWRRLLRDSRLWERSIARWRAGFAQPPRDIALGVTG
jgi:glycosyltransferase involved in cell wall biosynthesis